MHGLLARAGTRAVPRAARAARRAAAACFAGGRAAASSAKDVLLSLANPTPEHAALRATVRAFAEERVAPQARAADRAEEFNAPLFRELGGLGLLGVTADEAVGGAGMDAVAACIVHEELAAVDPGFCLAYLAHSLLFVNNLNVNGSPGQKAAFLPDACAGRTLAGMCMSEPEAGTDVLGMRTTATRSRDGAAYTLRGSKMWITNGAKDDARTGDVFLVYARSPPEAAGAAAAGAAAGGAAAPAARPAYSLFLVEAGMKGFSLGRRIKDKCGMRASNTAELVFDDVVVPAATHLVGAEGGALLCMMRNLEVERVALAAMSLGIARRCVDVMSAYAASRRAFGQPISRFGQVQRHVAESYAEYAAGRAYVYAVAGGMDLAASAGRLDSDGVKLYASVMGTTVANRAMQVLGGNGYVGEYDVERLWRDAKLLEIGGGTLESHHKNMTRDLAKLGRLA